MKKTTKYKVIASAALFFSSINTASAVALSEGQFDWGSLSISANNTDITSSLTVSNPYNFLQLNFEEEGVVFPTTTSNVGVTDFSQAFSINDGGLATSLSSSAQPNLLNVNSQSEYTSEGIAYVERGFDFVAPSSGDYSFGIDILGEISLDNLNTEDPGSPTGSRPSTSIFFDMTFINNTQGTGFNSFTEGFIDFNLMSPDISLDETLAINALTDGIENNLAFDMGDSITFFVTAQAFTRSYSSEQIPAVPVPAALWFFAPALLMMRSFIKTSK